MAGDIKMPHQRGRESDEPPTIQTTEIIDMANIMEALLTPRGLKLEVERPDKFMFAVTEPNGIRLRSLKPFMDEFRLTPETRAGRAIADDLTSFIAHVNRFAGPDSAIFCHLDSERMVPPRFVAVYDYHPSGPATTTAAACAHRCEFQPSYDPAWRFWMGKHAQAMGQGAFAEMMEDRIGDFLMPDLRDESLARVAAMVEGTFATPSELLALSRGLAVSVNATVKEAVTLATGQISVQYEEVHTNGAGAPIKVPNLAVLGIPIWLNGPLFKVPVRLRYGVDGKGLRWKFLLYRPEVYVQHATDEIMARLRADTALPVLAGIPEPVWVPPRADEAVEYPERG